MSVAALVLAVGVLVGVAWLVARAVAWSDVHRDSPGERGARVELEADDRAQSKEINRIAAQRGVLPDALLPAARARLERLRGQWHRRPPALFAYAACGPAGLVLLALTNGPGLEWWSILWLAVFPAIQAREWHQELVRLERAVDGYRAATT